MNTLRPTPVSWPAVAVFSLLAGLPAQGLPKQSPRVSHYDMQVELRPSEKLIVGTQRITWTNTTAHPTDELQFHLYINAFRSPESTFMRESTAEFRGRWRADEFGWVRFDQIELVGPAGNQELPSQDYIQPDDKNADDATVLSVALPSPVAPGESVTLATQFRTKLPKAYRRTGFVPSDGFYCMHWFPKLGVLQERDGRAVWNCHQFHANTEFFADYSGYRVAITLPEEFVVGATGSEVERREVGNGRKTVVFEAQDVHDFAWVADPDFVVHTAEFTPETIDRDAVATAAADALGVPQAERRLPMTRIRLLLRPEHDTETQVRRHVEAVTCALRFFGSRFGPYPYPTITVVDPGQDVLGQRLAGGMEYPTLITCGTALFPHPRAPRPEGVTVHEFGHQYWYGLSGNNEFEESWLDEGLNTYSEGRAQWLHYRDSMRPTQTTSFGVLTVAGAPGLMEDAGGLRGAMRLPGIGSLWWKGQRWLDRVGFRGTFLPTSPLLDVVRTQPTATLFREASFSDGWNDRRRWLAADNPDAMVRPGWDYLSRDAYVVNSYTRPATVLRTMERLVGTDRWWAFLRRFHAEARFQHPTTQDFTRLLAETCGNDAAAFFENAIRAGARFDYGVHSVHRATANHPVTTVTVRRYGVLAADVRVRFTFAGQDPIYRTFEATELYPWKHFVFAHDEPGAELGALQEVWVDPPEPPPEGWEFDAAPEAGVYLIDENLLNNAWQAERDHDPALFRGVRLLLQTQSRLSFSGLMG